MSRHIQKYEKARITLEASRELATSTMIAKNVPDLQPKVKGADHPPSPNMIQTWLHFGG